MEYLCSHSKGKVPIVMISGLGSKFFVWSQIVKTIKQHIDAKFCMIELNNETNTDKMAKNIYYIIKKVINWSKESKIHLIGWSLGGMVAQKLAIILIKKKIQVSLALVSSSINLSLTKLVYNAPWYNVASLLLSSYSKEKLINSVAQSLYAKKITEDTYKTCEQIVHPDSYYYFLFHGLAAISHSLDEKEIQQLKNITPLVLSGMEDIVIRSDVALKTAKILDVPAILIPECGHDPMNDSPELTSEYLIQHLKKNIDI